MYGGEFVKVLQINKNSTNDEKLYFISLVEELKNKQILFRIINRNIDPKINQDFEYNTSVYTDHLNYLIHHEMKNSDNIIELRIIQQKSIDYIKKIGNHKLDTNSINVNTIFHNNSKNSRK